MLTFLDSWKIQRIVNNPNEKIWLVLWNVISLSKNNIWSIVNYLRIRY
jgi:hypothetical protein